MAVKDVGVKFEFTGADRGRSEMEKTGQSYQKLSQVADQVSNRINQTHTGILGHIGRFNTDLKAKLSQLGHSSVGGGLTAGRATLAAGAGALVGGGLLGLPFALATARAPITKEVSKNLAAGITAAENKAIQQLGGTLTGKIPYLTMQNWMEGSRDIYQIFRDQNLETKGALAEAAARAARALDMTVRDSGELLAKFNEAFGHEVKDKKAFAEKTYGRIVASQATAGSQRFDPAHLKGMLGIAPQLKEAGWSMADVLTASRVLGPAGEMVLSKITSKGSKGWGELLARTNEYWREPEIIETMKKSGGPREKADAEFQEQRNKKLILEAKEKMRSQVRLGLGATLLRMGEIVDDLKVKMPGKWEDLLGEHGGIRSGAGLSELTIGRDWARSGKLKEIFQATERGGWGQVLGLNREIDEGVDAKLAMLGQRLKKFVTSWAWAFEPLTTAIMESLGNKAEDLSKIFTANMGSISRNVSATVEGINGGIASISGSDLKGLNDVLKGLVAPDPEGWKKWGKDIGEWIGEAKQSLGAIADALTTIAGIINFPINVGSFVKKKVLRGTEMGVSAYDWLYDQGMPTGIKDFMAQHAQTWAQPPKWTRYPGVDNRLSPWGHPGVDKELQARRSAAESENAAAPESERVLPGWSRLRLPGLELPEIRIDNKPQIDVSVKIDGRELQDIQCDYLVRENARARRGAGDNALGFGAR